MKFDMPQPDEAVDVKIDDKDQTKGTGGMSRQWVAFLTKLRNDAVWRGRSGTTAQRPTDGLEIGTPFYDTTLGYQINVHQVSPIVVWHNGAGAAV